MSSDARPSLHPDGPSTRPSAVEALRGHRLPGRQPAAPPPSEQDPTTDLMSAENRLGPYTLIEQVGQGGMGVVHRAIGPDGREVAMKVLRAHIAHDEGARDRLRREVHTLARVRHEAVAPVLDADLDGPQPYLVTSFVPGQPLDEAVRTRGPLSGAQLARLGRGLAEALRAIHAVGVVHRDVKPGNVLMVGDDPVVIDFGIAQAADDVRLTMTGLVMGTPGYLSPEVVEGAPVSESTDWWGWAATLAFAASGQAPFGRGPIPVVLDRVTRGEADLAQVDPRLRPLLERALSPVPRDRPSAQVVLAELEEYARGGYTTGLPVQPSTSRFAAAAAMPSAPSETQLQPAVPATQLQPQAAPDPTAHLYRPVPSAPGIPSAAAPPPRGPVHQPGLPLGYPPPPGASRVPAPDGRQQSSPQRDPRIGQSARSGVISALLAALVGLALVLPAVALLILVVWTVAARWVDRSITSMVVRRFEGGRRRSDGVMAVVASPWHGLRAVLSGVLALILPTVVGVVGAVTIALLLSIKSGQAPQPEAGLPAAGGLLLAAWVLWWGPGGPSLRRGTRSLVRGMFPAGHVGTIVTVLALAVAGLAAVIVLTSGATANWWPFTFSTPSWSRDWIPSQFR